MSFISFTFFLFFLLVIIGRFLLGPNKNEKSYLSMLLVASLVFYGSFVPWYLLLLLFTTLVDFYVGNKIDESTSLGYRKTYLVLSLVANLGLLIFFKYLNFLIDSSQLLLNLFHVDFAPPHWDMALPIGISFFTFQSMSYTIDIYRGVIKPEKTYWRFLLFVCFFTHLISGPIVRARELLYQFDRKRKVHWGVWLQGLYLIIFGLFMKMVVADNLADFGNKYWARGGLPLAPSIVPWTLAVLFSCQILADFWGYSTIAMGSAYLLGFKLPVNFNCPYIACSFREFWTRWHITLSRWIRDYLYIPLGGNKGSKVRVFSTLLMTLILAGLWHGSAFTFLIWGAIHGLALGLERLLGMQEPNKDRQLWLRWGWYFIVQIVVIMAWVFFRAINMTQALQFIQNMFNPNIDLKQLLKIMPAFIFVLPIVIIHLRGFMVERGWVSKPRNLEKSVLAAFMFYCVLTLYGKNNAFIYFQF